MPKLLGEYEVKVDAKGRLRVPSDLIKQLGDGWGQSFVVNRGLDEKKHLVLHPKNVWDEKMARINGLNTYRKKNREFVRYFLRGAAELEMDKADRLLLPKRLLEYAGIEKELVLFAVQNVIEIWPVDGYDNMVGDEPDTFADLAEEVMGDFGPEMESE